MWQKSNLYRRIWEAPYGNSHSFQLFDAAKNNQALVQRLRLQAKLPVHKGCVNTICWNESGEYILSGSDDQHLCITNGFSHEVAITLQTGHRANIFSAKFLPNCDDKQVISCSGDGMIIYTNVDRPETSTGNIFNCHFGTAYEITTVPNDPHTFLSCGEDGTVRWFDLRMKNRCSLEECKEDILISCRCAVTSIAVNVLMPYQLGVGCGDSSVRIFDRRMLGTRATGNHTGNGIQAMTARFRVPEFDGRTHRITSLCYSPDGQEMLVSYSSDFIYLFSVQGDSEESPKVLSPRTKEPQKEQGGRAKSSRPMMKRLRVRGDWSDTGPNARPESEMRASGEYQPRSLHASLMQRMSDVLTRMFTGPSRTIQQQTPTSVGASPNRSERDASSDEENEHSRTQESNSDVNTQENAAEHPRNEVSKPVTNDEERPDSESLPVENSVEQPSLDNSISCSPSIENDAAQDLSLVPSTKNNSQVANDSISMEQGEPVASCSNVHPIGTEMCAANQEHDADVEVPGNSLFNQSLQNLEQELSTQRRDFLEKHNIEPMVNLCYTGQSMNSGLITMGVSGANSLEQFEVPPSSHPVQPTGAETSESCDICGENNEASTSRSDSASEPNDIIVADSNPTIIVQAAADDNEPSQSPSDRTSSQNDLATPSSSAKTNIVRTGVEVEINSDERRNSYQGDEENESPFLMEVERWECDSSSDDESGSRSQSEQSTSRAVPTTSNPPGKFMKLLRERRKEKAQLMSVPQPSVKQKYTGHRNARTMIKEATFWGNDFVMSGSDCGHIFVWNRYTSELVMLMEGDQHVVNCLQPHPFDPVLASSGIDYDVKLWAPLNEGSSFDEDHAQKVIQRNEVMLEETKDTITVPASFMIRMLASLNHLRSADGSPRWRTVRESRTDDSDSSNQ